MCKRAVRDEQVSFEPQSQLFLAFKGHLPSAFFFPKIRGSKVDGVSVLRFAAPLVPFLGRGHVYTEAIRLNMVRNRANDSLNQNTALEVLV